MTVLWERAFLRELQTHFAFSGTFRMLVFSVIVAARMLVFKGTVMLGIE